MGNTIDPEIVPEISKLSRAEVGLKDPKAKTGQKNNPIWKALVWLCRNQRTRRFMLRLYNNLYEVFSS
jgi:hypothetical protein